MHASKVVIVDDDPVVRAVLRAILEAEPDFEVVGTAPDAEEGIAAAARAKPDIVLLDVHMPGGGPAAARGIAERCPEARMVALSAAEDVATVRAMLDAGVDRYAVKSGPTDELLALMRALKTDPPAPAQQIPRGTAVEPVGVLVALRDSDTLLAIASLVGSDPGMRLIGLAQTPAHAATLAARHRPAMAIVDAGLEAGGGDRASVLIHAASPETKIVGVSELDPRAHSAPGTLSAGLDQAIAGGMVTYLQPIVDLRDGRPVGQEALTRFTLEPVKSPDVWFAEAAAVGRSLDLEIAAARRALNHLQDLPEGLWLAINVAPDVARDPALADLIHPDLASRVVLEMTEHSPVRDYSSLAEALAPLRDAGVRVAVDDAGAGFSSLRHILQLEPDFIKLDTSLCRGIGADPARSAMARALVGFARETGSTVIAEGLESADDVAALRGLDVPLGQGYQLGRPHPAGGRFQRLF